MGCGASAEGGEHGGRAKGGLPPAFTKSSKKASVSSEVVEEKDDRPQPTGVVIENKGTIGHFYNLGSEVIAKGRAGNVRRVENKASKQLSAMKAINKRVTESGEDTSVMAKHEIECLKLMDHPNVAKLYETFEDPVMHYLVFENCTGGELFENIVDNGRFSEREAANTMQHLLRGICHMHRKFVAHRGLCPENILLRNREPLDSPKQSLKIVDFSQAAMFHAPGDTLQCDKRLRTYYSSPQLIEFRAADETCDCWSAGVIMYVMLNGYPPDYTCPYEDDGCAVVMPSCEQLENHLKICRFRKGRKYGPVARQRRPQNLKERMQIRNSVSQDTFDYADNLTNISKLSDDAKNLLDRLLTFHQSARVKARDAVHDVWIKGREKGGMTKSMCGHAEREHKHSNPLKVGNQMTNMKKFAAQNQLKKMALAKIAHRLEDEEIVDLKKTFLALDTDDDGIVSFTELQEGLVKLGSRVEKDKLEVLLHELDVDGSDSMDYTEFIAATISKKHYDQDGVCWAAFRSFDPQGDNKITREDLLENELEEGETDKIMQDFDIRNKGFLNFEDFMRMMRKDQMGDVHYTRDANGNVKLEFQLEDVVDD